VTRSAGCALALALAALCLAAPLRAEEEDELEALRRAIGEHRERVERAEQEARSLFESLEEMERAIEALAADARRARGEAGAARARLLELAAEQAELDRRLAGARQALSARAVALYKDGEPGPLRVLFSSESLPDLLRRMELLRLLAERDRSLIREAQGAGERLRAARAEARRVAEEGEAAAARLALRSSELERERAARRALLARVRSDRRRGREALYELERAARALEETLERLGRSPARGLPARPALPFASRRGRLESPVEGRLAGSFGRVVDREFATETFRKGVELEAEAGSLVRAVAEGEVRFAGWFRGYGKLVILDHGDDWFTVSGHLDELAVEVGARVAEGDPIGTVGETGSLHGPRLYFEVRRGGTPQDPLEWLRHPMLD
jgi:septal ring factor EnvC (AmiA/AmiB activator)